MSITIGSMIDTARQRAALSRPTASSRPLQAHSSLESRHRLQAHSSLDKTQNLASTIASNDNSDIMFKTTQVIKATFAT
jgi:hypothetical protein